MRTLSLHAPAAFTRTSSNFWTSVRFSTLSVFLSLICGFCPSDQGFAYSLFQIPSRGRCPAVQLCASSLPTRTRDFHPLDYAHAGQKEAPEKPKLLRSPNRQLYNLYSLHRFSTFSRQPEYDRPASEDAAFLLPLPYAVH